MACARSGSDTSCCPRSAVWLSRVIPVELGAAVLGGIDGVDGDRAIAGRRGGGSGLMHTAHVQGAGFVVPNECVASLEPAEMLAVGRRRIVEQLLWIKQMAEQSRMASAAAPGGFRAQLERVRIPQAQAARWLDARRSRGRRPLPQGWRAREEEQERERREQRAHLRQRAEGAWAWGVGCACVGVDLGR